MSTTVSREKEELRISPRATMLPPGSGSVFGSGFFGRFFKLDAAALLVFPALLAVGAAIFLFGLAASFGPYQEELRTYNPRIFLYATAIGGVFFLLVLRALQVELNRQRLKPARRPKASSKKEPWTYDYPWSASWMAPDDQHFETSILGKVTFFAFVALCNTLWYSGEPFWYIFLTFLDLIALAVLVSTLRTAFKAFRYRRPVVIWNEIPVYPGGVLEGRMAFPRDVRPRGPTRLTLRCVDEERAEGGLGVEGTDREVFCIYRETREIPLPGETGEPLDVLSFAFEIPRNLPGTNLLSSSPTYWQLVAEVPVLGPDLEAVFLAPVYQKRG